jgi:two-component system, response regulator PdtaR
MASRVRLIIVEDDALVVIGITLVLEEYGCEICGVAATAEEGIALADLHRPDLALVDVALADGSDGLMAARVISGRLGIPVVVCSAHATAEQALAAGACHFLMKPFDAMALSDAVQAPFRANGAVITLAA